VAGEQTSWQELIRQTASYLEILHQGGFCFAEGRLETLPGPATPKPKKTTRQNKPAPSALSAETREILKAALSDPFAHLVASQRKSAAAATQAPLAQAASRPTSPPPAKSLFTPPAGSLPPLSAQPPPAKSRIVTLRDRADALRAIGETKDLKPLRDLVSGCQMCGLAAGRTLTVFGEGNPKADLMFIGEGPGYHEDVQGKPFVGRAGALLTKMIQAMGLQRDQVFITNIVKCRPPGNRDPEPDEIKACEPFLKRQIEIIRPKIICALGRISIQGLLRDTTPISKVRGQWRTYQDIPLMPTFHPAFLLRSPDQKRLAWEDLKAVMGKWAELKKG